MRRTASYFKSFLSYLSFIGATLFKKETLLIDTSRKGKAGRDNLLDDDFFKDLYEEIW